MIAVDFEVHEPPELVDEIGRLIERLGSCDAPSEFDSLTRQGVLLDARAAR
jgi:hypothetical protein